MEKKFPLDRHLLALETLFKDLKENYKRIYLNKSEIEPSDTKH